MYQKHDDLPEIQDESQASIPTANPAAVDAQARTAERQRAQRIEEYREQAMTDPDPLSANFAIVSSEMFGFLAELGPMVSRALREAPDARESLPEVAPAMDAYLRMAKQINGFEQTRLRLAARQAD